MDVLIVDDEIEILNLLGEVLADEGYAVRFAQSGSAALVAVKERAPSLMLVDYTMPGMTGAEVVRTLRDQGFTELPVILMSAGTRVEAMHVKDASGFLAKPFDLENLLKCVSQYVGRNAA
ncbi:response regulator [Candidatus Gracilibacteria bacterium]|nr:response regulator [Candidatus Gracilibacteria bacterium]